MGTLNNFLGKFDRTGDSSDPSPHPFSALDVEKIKSALKLVKEGRERGEKNLPPSNSEAPDDIEQKIIATVEAERRRQLHALGEHFKAQHQHIAKLDLEHEAMNIASAAQRASTEFVVKVDEGKAKLFTLWRNVCMIEDQWNGFRKQHNLSHPADYPLSRLWNFAVILAILGLEAVLNGSFLARGLETGLMGGIIEAAVIAAINVAFGFFLGDYVLRYLFHRNFFMRALILIELPISGALSVFFNLLVGHYRDALSGSDPAHASTEAFANFMLHPFTLAAMESWMLFAMGLFFSLVAAIDGFKMDDPYPGYGKISRQHEAIIQDYTDEKASIVDDLAHTRDQALDDMQDARQNLATRRTELSNILDQRNKLIQAFEARRDDLDHAANDLLATYRNANISVRITAAPPHFNSVYSLPASLSLTSLPYAIHEELLDANITKTDEALQKAIHQVNTQFEQAVREFHQIGELTGGGAHAANATAA